MNPTGYLKQSPENNTFVNEEKNSKKIDVSGHNKKGLEAESKDLKAPKLVTQRNENKLIKCTNKGCKECSKYHSGYISDQFKNYPKPDISVEKYDHRKMSEVEFENFVPTDLIPPTGNQPEIISNFTIKVENEIKRQSNPIVTSSPLEKNSSHDLRSKQIRPKMKKEESTAKRHMFKTNCDQVMTHKMNTMWPKTPRGVDQNNKSAENAAIGIQMSIQKDPEQRTRNIWNYSCLPASYTCKCISVVFLLLTLAAAGVITLILYYNNTTTDTVRIIHRRH